MLDIAYGYVAKPENDLYIAITAVGLEGVEASGDTNIFDILPWGTFLRPVIINTDTDLLLASQVQHIPSWIPGFGWKRQVDAWRTSGLKLRDAPFEWVKDQLVSSTS